MIPWPPSRTRPWLANRADHTRKMIAQHQGPAVLVGHCCVAATIMKAGDRPDFAGPVTIAAFIPDAGESLLAARFG
jgi:hypothetical protein